MPGNGTSMLSLLLYEVVGVRIPRWVGGRGGGFGAGAVCVCQWLVEKGG